ncbi:MAG: hypothetical protein ACE15D_09335 [Candidatus Eisenbacteria bacterium]|nr:hypothetical protein [Candidatus Eisenbacteria bacterium]
MRIAWVPLVAVMGLAGAGGAVAQDESSPSPPTAPLEEPASAPKQVYQSLRDFGSFGASVGAMRFIADDDASKNALVRPSMQGTFRYRFNENWVGVGEFGFGWGAFQDRGDTVLAVTSGTIGLYRHVSDALGADWKLGAGGGFYRWNFKFDGKSIRDPKTNLFYRAIDPGAFVGLETEKRLTPHVTVLMTSQLHYLFSGNEHDFPTALGGNDAFVVLRAGVNYHFSPYEGILWERKTKRVIRLESGKSGS